MNIRGIILAAGASKRMGKNKLSVEINGKTMLEWVIQNAKQSRLSEVVLVYGEYDVETDIRKIYNSESKLGMSSSIKCGLKDFGGDGVMLILGDMPFVPSEVMNILMEEFEEGEKGIIVPACEGKRGNPVLIGRNYFDDLLANSGDKGAREIIQYNMDDVKFVEVGHQGIFLDYDDEESLKTIHCFSK